MKEELKQKAEDFYFKKYTRTLNIGEKQRYKGIIEAYIAGAKENGIQWHRLKDNPNDFPRIEGEYFVCYQNETGYKNTFILKWDEYNDGCHWIDDDCEIYDEGIIAWAEKPQFVENE